MSKKTAQQGIEKFDIVCYNISKQGVFMNAKDFIVRSALSNTYGKTNTNDFVYLDSASEKEGLDPKQNICYPTDYAVLNGTKVIEIDGPQKSCHTWLRSESGPYDVQSVYGGGTIGYEFARDNTTGIRPTIQLDTDMVVKAKQLSNLVFHFEQNKTDKKNSYYTFELGVMPKTYVGDQSNKQLESAFLKGIMEPTGKEYVGVFDENGKPFYNQEYTFENQKYVRVPDNFVDSLMLSDGSKLEKTGAHWVRVEPICWRIKNWKDLPKQLNPRGNGTAKTIVAFCDQAICNMPFHTKYDGMNRTLWQNSIIRAYLNGYDLHKEIEKGNGNKGYMADQNFSFEQNNFLSEAFDFKPNQKTMSKPARKRGYGVKILDKPLSTDEQIKFYIEKGKSFMLHGPSGVGKTRRIQEVDPDFVSIVLRNGILPEEIIGKTIYLNDDKTKAGKWVAPTWYQELCERCKAEPDKNHVLFIDEITNVKPSEQSLVFHLVLNKSIGPNIGKLPDNVVIVAAGNSMEESESAYNMPEPLFRRFDAHIYLKPDIQQWLEWGSEKKKDSNQLKIHPLVSNFVATYGDKVFYSEYNSDEPPKFAVDPRGWEQVSDIIYDNDGYLAKELVENKVGKEIASAFVAFAKTAPLEVEDVIDNNFDIDEIPKNFDSKYALAMSLRYADFEQIDKVRKFVGKYLGGEILAMYDSIWAGKDDEKAIFLEGLKNNQNKSFVQ